MQLSKIQFPDHFSDDQITAHLNSIFIPHLRELSIICKVISESIDSDWSDKQYQVQELSGQISSLRGVIKGLELLQKEIGISPVY
jgi:hypothetical protein